MGASGQVAAVDARAQLPVQLVGQAFAAFKADVQFHETVRSRGMLRIADRDSSHSANVALYKRAALTVM
ncbi:hypothetical protein D3C80_2050580 [compost metagenome]